MKPPAAQAGLRPATGLCPVPCGGCAPATRKTFLRMGVIESAVSLPLVGPGHTRCWGATRTLGLHFHLTQPRPVWVTSLNELTGAPGSKRYPISRIAQTDPFLERYRRQGRAESRAPASGASGLTWEALSQERLGIPSGYPAARINHGAYFNFAQY